MKRLILIAALVSMSVLTPAGCGGSAKTEGGGAVVTEKPSESGDGDDKVFTTEELAEFDGKDGRQAYVAVDGVVYDLSGSSIWPEGKHTPCNLQSMAGRDLSEEIRQAPPRMREYLKRFPVVGSMAP